MSDTSVVCRHIPDEIRRLIGDDLARRFLAVYAGNAFTFPVTPQGRPFDALRKLVGPAAAIRLCERFRGEQVYIPRDWASERAARNAEIVARVDAGEPRATVARSLGVTLRWVQRVVQRAKEADGNDGGADRMD